MAQRGFYNDNETVPGRSHSVEQAEIVRKVTSSGGWIRHVLQYRGVVVNTDEWQGRSGYDVAVDLVQQAHMLGEHPSEAIAARRAQFLGQCAEVLGCEVEPAPERLCMVPFASGSDADWAHPIQEGNTFRADLPA